MGRDSVTGARLRAPGVYIEHHFETADRGFETGVPLFVGFASLTALPATDNEPSGNPDSYSTIAPSNLNLFRIESVQELTDVVVDSVDGGFLVSAVRGFFDNGGQHCFVAAIERPSNHPEIELQRLFESGGALELLEGVDLVCVPDLLVGEIAAFPARVLEIQRDVLAYCERMGDRFAILDGRRELLETLINQDSKYGAWRVELPLSVNGAGAVYAPWIGIRSDGEGARVRMVPPCGHVAGIYARCDERFGPHKPPANEIVEGAVDLASELTDAMNAEVYDLGVNALRSLPGRGIRVWGARTLSSQPGWRYVNVRRVFLTFTRWLEISMADLVLEPHTESLWIQIRLRIRSYCAGLMQRGALVGRDPNEAYIVKCDAETNPPDVRDQGLLVSEIGLATVVPAEFIYVRVTQSTNGTVATPILR